MKRIFLILTVFISATVLAQETIETTIGEFTELKVYDFIQVKLIKAEENRIVITGDKAEDIIVKNKNGTLKIRMNLDKKFSGSNINVTLYYSNIDVIDVNEGAQVTSVDPITQFEIDLRAQEGGTISVPIEVKHTLIKSISGGVITVTGTSRTQRIAINTGGVYKGEALTTEETIINVNAGGEAFINASKTVDITIKAGGDVYIYGHPETVIEKIALGGRVKRMY